MGERFWAVDRIEGAFAVLEDSSTRETFDYPLAELPLADLPLADLSGGVKEGDVLRKDADGNFFIDGEETKKRKERARNMLDRLKKRYRQEFQC